MFHPVGSSTLGVASRPGPGGPPVSNGSADLASTGSEHLLTATQDHPPTTGPASSRGAGLFLREFVRAPLRTASVLPSSSTLALRMLDPLRSRSRPVLLELGPGTGAMSSLVPALAPGGVRHIAVENNQMMARHLARRCPWIEVIEGSAAELP